MTPLLKAIDSCLVTQRAFKISNIIRGFNSTNKHAEANFWSTVVTCMFVAVDICYGRGTQK